ncbi:hypothetical protein PGB90_005209 [Kerria lacca]
MFELEKQYMELHDIIINERLNQIALKLEEIKCGEASEYLQPLAELEENMRIRSEVAGVLRQYRLKNLENEFEAEELTAKQNFENEKQLLYDSTEDDLKEKIKHLEEDRNNVDINADLWMVERGLSKSGKVLKDKKHVNQIKGGSHRNLESASRRKPVTVFSFTKKSKIDDGASSSDNSAPATNKPKHDGVNQLSEVFLKSDSNENPTGMYIPSCSSDTYPGNQHESVYDEASVPVAVEEPSNSSF